MCITDNQALGAIFDCNKMVSTCSNGKGLLDYCSSLVAILSNVSLFFLFGKYDTELTISKLHLTFLAHLFATIVTIYQFERNSW